jgi:hypothetical protein
MESLRKSFGGGILKRIEQELGRDVTLRLLWPSIVGSRLAGNAQLTGVRGNTLIVSVPDRSWMGPLGSLDQMILDAVNRMGFEKALISIEFVEDPRMAVPPEASRPAIKNSGRVTDNEQLDVDTATIADQNLRRLFLESGRKYLSAPVGIVPAGGRLAAGGEQSSQRRGKGSNSQEERQS